MRLQQHIGHNGFLFQFGMFALQARVLIATDVVIRPSIESPGLYVGNVIGHQIVSQGVTPRSRNTTARRFFGLIASPAPALRMPL